MHTSIPETCRQRVIVSAAALVFAALGTGARAATTDVAAPGDASQSYTVNTGDTLNVESGAATNAINVNGGTLTATGATIATSTANTIGVAVRASSTATITNSSIASTTATGLEVSGTSGATDGGTTTVTGGTITGLVFGATVSASGTLALTNTTVTNDSTTTGGFNAALVNYDSTLSVTGGTITGSVNGVWAAANSTSGATTSTTTLSGAAVTGTSGAAVLIQPIGTTGAFAGHTANVLIENGTTLSGGNGDAIEVNGSITGNVTIDNSTITGNVVGDGTATFNLTLQDSATLTGAATNVTAMSIDSTSKWLLGGNSSVTSLTLNSGTIDISGTALGSSTYHTLTLGTLSGTGTFLMDTNIQTHSGDLLVVTGTASGTYTLDIRNSGAEPTDLSALTVVQTGGGTATFSALGGKVDAGVYEYYLVQNGNNWELVSSASSPGGPVLTPSADTVLGLSGVSPTVWYGEATVLRSRLGDLRLNDVDARGGAWVRTFGKQYEAKPTDGANYRQTQYGVMGGVDGVVGKTWGGTWLAGVMLGTSHSRLSFDGGSTGSVDSYTAGLYATWLGDSGYYFDGGLKFNHFQNDADVIMSDGTGAHGGYNNNGVGATFEFGRHLAFGDNWFVEPYVQASVLRVGGDDFTLTNGLSSSTGHTGSIEAKVGAALGKTLELANGAVIRPYVKMAVVQEFVTNNPITVNGIGFNNNLSGTRVEFGAGVSGQIKHNLQLYAEVETGLGKRLDQPFGVQGDLRYTF